MERQRWIKDHKPYSYRTRGRHRTDKKSVAETSYKIDVVNESTLADRKYKAKKLTRGE